MKRALHCLPATGVAGYLPTIMLQNWDYEEVRRHLFVLSFRHFRQCFFPLYR